MLTKREQFIYDNVVYGGRGKETIWFYIKEQRNPTSLNARYVITENGGMSWRRNGKAIIIALPKRFVDILRIIAFPEVV